MASLRNFAALPLALLGACTHAEVSPILAGDAGSLCTSGPRPGMRCPNILFVVDQSQSMGEDPTGVVGGHPTKFELARDAVVNLVEQYGDHVPFGLELFAASGAINPGSPAADAICYSETLINVEPALPDESRLARSSDIITAVEAASPVAASFTNTGEAIARAAADPHFQDPSRGNFIVLITDGVPSCNSVDRTSLVDTGLSTFTIGKINAARTASPGLDTFVVGFDGAATAQDKANLDAFASAGGEAPLNCGADVPCYFSASDATALGTAFGKVVDTLGGEFPLTCNDSCAALGCPDGQVCVQGEDITVPPRCQAGTVCPSETSCAGGACVPGAPITIGCSVAGRGGGGLLLTLIGFALLATRRRAKRTTSHRGRSIYPFSRRKR